MYNKRESIVKNIVEEVRATVLKFKNKNYELGWLNWRKSWWGFEKDTGRSYVFVKLNETTD